MNPEKNQMFMKYIIHISDKGVSYDRRGKCVNSVLLFLSSTDDITRRGWLRYKKTHAEVLIDYPWMTDAVCEFLFVNGMGFKRNKIIKKSTEKMERVEKRDVRNRGIINDFILWLQNEKEYSPHTLQSYAFSTKEYFSYFDDFTQDNVRRYISQLENEGKSPKTIRLRITAMERLGSYLKKPVKLKRPKITKTLSTENIPTEKEYNQILDYCDSHNQKFAYIIRLMGTTGCRVSELLQFTYEQIQEGSTLLKGKGAKYRRFFFTKQIKDGAKGKSGYVCTNRYGSQMTARGVSSYLQHIGNKVGIDKKKMHPHAFRHFFAKMYLQKTKDVVGLAEILGHGSVDTTRIYLQKSYDEQKKEINRVVNW